MRARLTWRDLIGRCPCHSVMHRAIARFADAADSCWSVSFGALMWCTKSAWVALTWPLTWLLVGPTSSSISLIFWPCFHCARGLQWKSAEHETLLFRRPEHLGAN